MTGGVDLAEILVHARRAYGDLQNPDYGFFVDPPRDRSCFDWLWALLGVRTDPEDADAETPALPPWCVAIDQLRSFLRAEDWTGPDDVSYAYTLTTPRPGGGTWLLWLSGVGPFALLIYVPPDRELAERAHVRTGPWPGNPPEAARVFAILRDAGVTLLRAADVEATVAEFRPWHGEVPASVFTVLFSEDELPWRHANF
ncbi:hypothetical protein [Goodfellowiella coeruleoviolacea]|uniref:Uncharacterized protein n=1 Tax=Goodfellowiella coeruleoviolacea TaxID=334858 RepID=A0AAE3KJA9_9PSEU|nr:hypothetical protein [Goodfellowiella coeruleoviolacea]MCP2168847.1 hypothetical protein [Goodfellowiella coeruleoviolacea]